MRERGEGEREARSDRRVASEGRREPPALLALWATAGRCGTAERRVLPSVSGVLTPRHLWSTCVTRRNPRAGVCRGSKGLSGLKEHGC